MRIEHNIDIAAPISRVWELTLDVDSEFPNAFGWLFASFAPVQPYTVPGIGCNIYVDILNPANFYLVTMFITDGSGDWQLALPIPDVPAMSGMELVLQTLDAFVRLGNNLKILVFFELLRFGISAATGARGRHQCVETGIAQCAQPGIEALYTVVAHHDCLV